MAQKIAMQRMFSCSQTYRPSLQKKLSIEQAFLDSAVGVNARRSRKKGQWVRARSHGPSRFANHDFFSASTEPFAMISPSGPQMETLSPEFIP